MVADIGHLKQVFIQSGVDQGFLEQWFMGLGRTGCDDNPIQVLFLDDLADGLLGILGTGVQVIRGIFDVGQGCRIFGNGRHIDDAGDINAAATDKYADPRTLIGHIDFRHHFRRPGEAVARLDQYFSGGGGRGTGVDNRLRNVFWSLESAADKNTVPGSFDRGKCAGLAEFAGDDVDVQAFGQINDFR